MSERSDEVLIADMVEAIYRIENYVAGLSYDTFVEVNIITDAVERNFTVLGEVSKRLSPKINEAHPEIPWRKIGDFRNRITHDYFSIQYSVVWSIIQEDLPNLKQQLSEIKFDV